MLAKVICDFCWLLSKCDKAVYSFVTMDGQDWGQQLGVTHVL